MGEKRKGGWNKMLYETLTIQNNISNLLACRYSARQLDTSIFHTTHTLPALGTRKKD
jgi:hypothetical protein